MRIAILILVQFFFFSILSAQIQGKVHYTEVLNKEAAFGDMPDEFKKMMPETQVFEKELIFDQSQSIYKVKEGLEGSEDIISNDSGTMMFFMDNDEDDNNLLYKSYLTDSKIHQRTEEGKIFLISDTLEKQKWRFTGEKIKYLGYECNKAIMEDDSLFVVAWYTPQIPAFTGPREFQGLPGLILMVSINEGGTEIRAKSVDLKELGKKELRTPRKGKKVTEQELEKILEDYKAERKSQYKRTKLIKRNRY